MDKKKFTNPFRRRRYRGKSKSPEAKLREQRAKVDSLVMAEWLKMLKRDPDLLARIAEQRHGSEAIVAYGDGDYSGEPDLLSVLRQAREAKDLIRDELGEGKGSTIRDIAEVLKALPGVLQSLGQFNPAQLRQFANSQAQIAERQVQQIETAPKEQPEKQPDINSVPLDKLMMLIELEPQQAWDTLVAEGEEGWLNYLRATTYEQLEATLRSIGEQNPEFKPHIDDFLEKKSNWLAKLITIAHQSEQK
jgi:hypothetical protein